MYYQWAGKSKYDFMHPDKIVVDVNERQPLSMMELLQGRQARAISGTTA